MICTIHDSVGRIVMTGSFPSPEIRDMNIPADGGWIDGLVDPDGCYVANGEAVPFPASPGEWAIWDWAAHEWTDSRDAEWFTAQLSEARATGETLILALRAQARLTYITDIPGQEGIYISKRDEAKAYLQLVAASEEPDMAEFPLIASEIGVTAPTAYEVAQVFLNLNAMWTNAAAAIDTAYFSAQIVIQAATTEAEVTAAVEGLRATLIAGGAI